MLRCFPYLALLILVVVDQPALAQKIQFDDVTAKAGLVDSLVEIQGHGGAWGGISMGSDCPTTSLDWVWRWQT